MAIEWTPTALPKAARWESVTYGDGKFVAVDASFEYSCYSIDGMNWIEGGLLSQEDDVDFHDVAYGNGKFVSVASGRQNNSSDIVAYSTDGINWKNAKMPMSTKWSSVAFGNGVFVAVAGKVPYDNGGTEISRYAFSNDGVTWELSNFPSSKKWSRIRFGNGRFIAIADGSTACYISADGKAWERGSLPSQSSWTDIAYGKGVFVTNGAYSEDNGKTWTAVDIGGQHVAFGGDKFVSVSTSGKFGYSTDGKNWRTNNDMPIYTTYQSVIYGNGKFVTVSGNSLGGSNAAAYLDSDDINALALWVGVNGKARKGVELYAGVNGKARKVTAAYIGVNGKARRFL